MFTIRNEKTGEILASGLTVEGVEGWWKQNEERFFGVRVDGETILVVKL